MECVAQKSEGEEKEQIRFSEKVSLSKIEKLIKKSAQECFAASTVLNDCEHFTQMKEKLETTGDMVLLMNAENLMDIENRQLKCFRHIMRNNAWRI